jgi:hypothetical protein
MKQLLFKFIILISGLLFGSQSSFAALGEGIVFNLGLSWERYTISQTDIIDPATGEEDTQEDQGTRLILNGSLGYSLGGGLLAGAKFYRDGSAYADITNDAESETTDFALGIMVGYTFDQFLFQFSYLGLLSDLERTRTSDNGNDVRVHSDGSGFILDAMYMFDLSGFSFGPQLSYISIEYNKYVINDVEQTDFVNRTETWVKPQFAFTAVF